MKPVCNMKHMYVAFFLITSIICVIYNILQHFTNDGLNRLVTYFNPVIDQQFRNDLPCAARYIEYVLTPVLSQYLRQPLHIRRRPDTCAVDVEIVYPGSRAVGILVP